MELELELELKHLIQDECQYNQPDAPDTPHTVIYSHMQPIRAASSHNHINCVKPQPHQQPQDTASLLPNVELEPRQMNDAAGRSLEQNGALARCLAVLASSGHSIPNLESTLGDQHEGRVSV